MPFLAKFIARLKKITHSKSSRDRITLSNLPADIIGRIFVVGEESAASMRRITPRWNDLYLEYIIHRRQSTVIKMMFWRIEHIFDNHEKVLNSNTNVESVMKIIIPKNLRRSLGVEGWDTEYYDNNARVKSPTLIANYFNRDVIMSQTRHIFQLCARIERLQLDMSILRDIAEFTLVKQQLARTSVEVLSFSGRLDHESANVFLDLLRVCSVRRLSLSSKMDIILKADTERIKNRYSPFYFFIEACKLVHEIIVSDYFLLFAPSRVDSLFDDIDAWRIVDALNETRKITANVFSVQRGEEEFHYLEMTTVQTTIE